MLATNKDAMRLFHFKLADFGFTTNLIFLRVLVRPSVGCHVVEKGVISLADFTWIQRGLGVP